MGEVELSLQHESNAHEFRPSIVAIIGPPLTGKSTLARSLSTISNFTPLDVDVARQEIFPISKRDMVLPGEQEVFAMLNSYQRNHEKARDLLNTGKPVVLVATYSRQIYHDMLRQLESKFNVPLKVILLSCSDEEIKRRIDQRSRSGDFSNVKTLDHYKNTKDRYQRINGVNILEVNTEQPLEECLKVIQNFVRDLGVEQQ